MLSAQKVTNLPPKLQQPNKQNDVKEQVSINQPSSLMIQPVAVVTQVSPLNKQPTGNQIQPNKQLVIGNQQVLPTSINKQNIDKQNTLPSASSKPVLADTPHQTVAKQIVSLLKIFYINFYLSMNIYFYTFSQPFIYYEYVI